MAGINRRYRTPFLLAVLILFGLKEACSRTLRSVYIQSVSENYEFRNGEETVFLLQSLVLPTEEKCRIYTELCPVVAQLRRYLRDNIVGRSLVIRQEEIYPRNRYGLPLLQMEELDGRWVQQYLLEQGLAQLRENDLMVDEAVMLHRAEDRARQARRGIWGTEFGAVKSAGKPGKLWPFLNSYQHVEGILQKIAYRGDWLYLNFGPDWREDFTVAIHHNDLSAKGWPQLVDDARRRRKVFVEGRYRVRVRGVLSLWNGPAIIIANPKQIEFFYLP